MDKIIKKGRSNIAVAIIVSLLVVGAFNWNGKIMNAIEGICCVALFLIIGTLFVVFVPEKSKLWQAYKIIIYLIIGLILIAMIIALFSIVWFAIFSKTT